MTQSENTKPAVTLWALCALLGLTGCGDSTFQVRPTAPDEAAYVAIFPYYLEYCAVSEFDKKKGIGLEIDSGGPGGHSVFYLNGVCRVAGAGYPEIALCEGDPKPGQGVGISVNDHFSNANWVATEGRDFFYRGGLRPNEALTRARFASTVTRAGAMGIYNGVVFHPDAFKGKPAGMSQRDYQYEVSVATDYAIGFGRDRYCARVPTDRAHMRTVVDYLNSRNAPYRAGNSVFHWNVLRDNCAHLAHNALARIGLWPEIPTNRPWLAAAFDFPVPRNEFVNLMRRTNELDDTGPEDDDNARAALRLGDGIAARAGGLAVAEPVIQDNEIYNTRLRMIFYDDPSIGRYPRRFAALFADPRYTDLRANLAWFAARYTAILGQSPRPGEHKAFDARYFEEIAARKAKLDAVLPGAPG